MLPRHYGSNERDIVNCTTKGSPRTKSALVTCDLGWRHCKPRWRTSVENRASGYIAITQRFLGPIEIHFGQFWFEGFEASSSCLWRCLCHEYMRHDVAPAGCLSTLVLRACVVAKTAKNHFHVSVNFTFDVWHYSWIARGTESSRSFCSTLYGGYFSRSPALSLLVR